ncbi:putative lipid II flippase FtsW [Candidatus Falkowbacteria bacterium]|nr:putative lipid II flippase FtsW [Candidatus Falkowbacteria bacterium]
MRYQTKEKKSDYVFLILLGLIVLFGLAMLSSASVAEGLREFEDNYYFLKKQITHGLLPGLLLFFVCWKIGFRVWKKLAWLILVISIVLLVLVFLPGIGTSFGSGARSWLNIFGFSVQPSEIAKLAFLIYLAAWFDERGGSEIKSWQYGFLPFVVVLGVVSGLVFMEPDVGTFLIIVIISLVVYFVAGARLIHLFFMTAFGFGAMILAIRLAPYRLQRLTVFLHPELDPQGVGYHINQALLAVGSGGFFGLGLGGSRQKFQYLPEVMGDSIFAVMAEELGFIFVTGFIVLFLFLIYRGLRIAKESRSDFARYLVVGIVSWWFFQAVINIGGMIGVLPMTGLPLPFISLGGTALAISLAAAGIIMNISKERT